MIAFKEVRLEGLKAWNQKLNRHRNIGELTDDSSNSMLCKWQAECVASNKHCSFLCSLDDWLDNISDVLHDERFDKLDLNEENVLFRYYTRFLLLVSEVVEDFVLVNKEVRKFGSKGEASRDLEKGILDNYELQNLSNFINTVCKHKTERNNLHVHNHHLTIEFDDFGDKWHENQIRLGNENPSHIDQSTTILIPKLTYLINIIALLNNKIDNCIKSDSRFKQTLFELYADEWDTN